MNDFAECIAKAAREAGYNIDTPRGGGRKKLAEDIGISATSVGRMLSGQTEVEARMLPIIAKTLGLPVEELLRLRGLLGSPVGEGPKPHPVTAAVVGTIRDIRDAQRVSARDLAGRMSALGYPTERSVIANCESGRRSEISVDHLVFAAKALNVDAVGILRGVTDPCPNCNGTPPEGFTCNTCGGAA